MQRRKRQIHEQALNRLNELNGRIQSVDLQTQNYKVHSKRKINAMLSLEEIRQQQKSFSAIRPMEAEFDTKNHLSSGVPKGSLVVPDGTIEPFLDAKTNEIIFDDSSQVNEDIESRIKFDGKKASLETNNVTSLMITHTDTYKIPGQHKEVGESERASIAAENMMKATKRINETSRTDLEGGNGSGE